MSDAISHDLLNLYEVEENGQPRFLVCFLEPERAEELRGIPSQVVVGEYQPDASGEFDPASFRPNHGFINSIIDYMNDEVIRSEDLIEQARDNAGGWLMLYDHRNSADLPDLEGDGPPESDMLGAFDIDESGQARPHSFQYNPEHLMFDPERGPSFLLTSRPFYDWIQKTI